MLTFETSSTLGAAPIAEKLTVSYNGVQGMDDGRRSFADLMDRTFLSRKSLTRCPLSMRNLPAILVVF